MPWCSLAGVHAVFPLPSHIWQEAATDFVCCPFLKYGRWTYHMMVHNIIQTLVQFLLKSQHGLVNLINALFDTHVDLSICHDLLDPSMMSLKKKYLEEDKERSE
eukprot:gene2539-biopygen11526